MKNKNDVILVAVGAAAIAVMWFLSWLLYK